MKVVYFDNLFTDEDLAFLQTRFRRGEYHYIQSDKEIASFIFGKCLHALQTEDSTIHFAYDDVTFSKHVHAIQTHVDLVYDKERYKVGVYLNELTQGGTIFYDTNRNEYTRVPHKKGRVVMFDIRLPHAGEALVNREQKYMVGIRVR